MRFISVFCGCLLLTCSVTTVAALGLSSKIQSSMTGGTSGLVHLTKTGAARGACIKKCKSSYNCPTKSAGDREICKADLKNCIAACK